MVMTCRHVQQLRDSYLDGELSSSLSAEVHAHLLQCPECQQKVEMIRVAGHVIATDCSEPPLRPDFAQRVVACLPSVGFGKPAGLMTRRVRRQYFWRRAFGASLPAAAAVLFFCVLVWPTAERSSRPTLVKAKVVEAVGASSVVEPTLGALEGTRQAADSVNRVFQMGMDEAQRNVRRGLEQFKTPAMSFVDIMMEPFNGLLDTGHRAPAQGDTDGIVRF
ncbi:MAG TPA: anti-sigma factor [Phycisphaerae bacterium]|nr:anti-sigma factor [Phycisphaerae bacterium]